MIGRLTGGAAVIRTASRDVGTGIRQHLSANRRFCSLLLAAALLILLAAQALGGAAASSITFDEPCQMAAGYAYLRTGDARLSRDHPPLMDVWLSLPLFLLKPDLPLHSDAWQQAARGTFGDVFLWQANTALALRMVWLGRLPNIALALLLGAAIFCRTSRLVSRSAGLLALALYVLDPNIVANAGVSTNDLGVTAMLFLAAWVWWEWLEQPSVGWLMLAGVLAGATCTSKYSGLIIGPIALLLTLVHRPITGRRTVAWLRRLAGLTGMGLVCCLTIWAVYGFAVTDSIPAAEFWEGIRFQGSRLRQTEPVYAVGRVWTTGVWFYYPLALFLKTPVPTLLLTGLGLFVAIRRHDVRRMWPLLIPAAVFGIVASSSTLQLGYRYLLPMLPFMFCLGGGAATAIPGGPSSSRQASARRGITGILLAWLALNAATIYPHHLSFFNELAGGPAHGDFYLVDSNLDWGQDLPALRHLMEERDIPFVYLGYFGSAIPDEYGIRYWPAPGFPRFVVDVESRAFNPYTPDPGWYAISRTSLRQGLMSTHTDLYTYFGSQPIVARAGYSINLYHVAYPPSTPIVRAVVEGTRVADVPAEQLGWREGQRLIAKWVPDGDSFVLAMSGPTRYLVSEPLGYAPDLREALLSHAGWNDQGVMECDTRQAVQPLLASWTGASPLWTPEGNPLATPVIFDGRVALLGYRLAADSVSPGEELSLVLLWQVSGDLRPPIASFVHLLGKDGMPVSQYDGWGSAIRGLEVGDVIVHHVRIPIPSSTTPGRYRLQVGVYSPNTMLRWPTQAPDGTQVDRIWLSEVEVR